MVINLIRKEISSIHAAAFLIGAAGFLSRILGVLRDRLLASHFGASRTLDIYYASFQIPDFLFTVLLVGAASAAILPIFLRYWEEDKERGEKLIGGLLLVFSGGAAILAGSVALLAPYLVRIAAPGFNPSEHALMITMTRIMMFSPVFLGISNIFSSVIQATRQFAVFALTSVLYNIGIICGILFLVPFLGPAGLAWGVVLGAFLHMSIQIPALRHLHFTPRLRGWVLGPDIQNVLFLSIPRVFALSLSQIIDIVLIAIGSKLAAGSIAIYQFSDNLRYVLIGIIGVPYAIAAFPKLVSAAEKKSKAQFYGDFRAMIVAISFWVIPLASFIVLLRAHIVRLTLGVGRFSWDDTRLTAAALALFALAIIAESLIPLLLRAFYAIGNTRLPLLVSLFTAFFVASSAPLFVALFTSHRASGRLIAALLKVGDIQNVGVLGLVMAFTIGTLLDLVFLSLVLSNETKKYFGTGMPDSIVVPLLRILFASLSSVVLGYGVLYLLSFSLHLTTFISVLTEGTITFLIGAAFYVGIMYITGSEEVRSVMLLFKKRLFRLSLLPREVQDPGAPLE